MSFDDEARNWDNDAAKVERARLLANEIRNFIKPDGSTNAFELGCGTGLLSFFLKDDFKSITMADTSPGMLEVLKKKIEEHHITNMHPVLVDVLKSKLDVEPVQVIYTLMTLHHIKDISPLLKTLHNMLLKEGYVCIGDLETEDGSFHAHHPHFDGHRGFDRKDLEQEFRQNGFEPVYYHTFYTLKRKVDNRLKEYPLFVLIGKKI